MRQLCKGNVAVIKGAVLAGCRAYYGYPITPASEVAEAAALYFPEVGGTFVQAESETASINMVYGAASAGQRVMTASSGPGLSLMQEGISYLAGAELPCVIVDVMRGGPGLGNIAPEQSDYFAMVKGGGHGNFRNFFSFARSWVSLGVSSRHVTDGSLPRLWPPGPRAVAGWFLPGNAAGDPTRLEEAQSPF
jgi:pyruvate/2-oxoacid:ferredoxin oxidoreductase alpha subunit